MMPADSIHPIDSVTSTDSAAQHYQPQYVDGFPAAHSGDSALGSIDTLAVMELPGTAPARPFASSPLHDTPSMVLLIVGLLAVALSYHKGYKYIENFFHYMFSTRRRENLFEDHTVNETSIQAALIANTCIVEGFLMFMAMQLLRPGLINPAALPGGHTFVGIGICTLLAVGFYIAQWLAYRVIGYTFSDREGTRLWIDGFKSSQSLLGLLLVPIVFLLMLYPSHGKLLLSVATLLYLVTRVIFIYKGLRIFYGNLSSILYFILYLCAVEIVPLVILTSVTIRIFSILQ